ncbi:type II toxin-antitoxin system VapC family toxin [Streptomyces sp. NPDC060064]|uniref:type II toxin-antitoxin system VapC family toxin n=1 Tax=Streptomyces sp. NPDC060064 TaxID=3347049 RepID=UPI0036C82C92
MQRAVLDSNAVDPIIDLPGAYSVVSAAVDEGRVELLITHILEEEVAATPDPERRAKLQQVLGLGRPVPTGAFVFDVSKFDLAAWGDNEPSVEALRSGNIGNTNDALIGITADSEQATLVTKDDRLTKRARELGLEVLTPLEFLTALGFSGVANAGPDDS